MLHALEDPRGDLGLVPLRRAVDHPHVVGGAAEVVAHPLEARPVEKAGHRDEADDSRVVFRVVVEHLPCRPAPEVDVEVAQVFGVRSDAPLARRHPCLKRRRQVRAARLHPAAQAPCLFLVGRVADHHHDRLLSLDRIGLSLRLRDRLQHRGNPLQFDVGIAQRVGDEHPRRRGRRRSREVGQLGEDAQLRDRKRPELDLKCDETLHGLVDRRRYSTGPSSAATRSAMRRSTPRRKVPVPTAGSASVTSGEARP